MRIIDAKAVEEAASYNQWVDAIEESFRMVRGVDYQMPVRTHIDFGPNTLLLMPCITDKYFATKVVSIFPGNTNIGRPPLSGNVLLNSGETGEPLALIDGAPLTAFRTAAVGSFAIRHLAPETVSSLGIIGAGKQGLYQALFACSQREFKVVNVYDQYSSTVDTFVREFGKSYPGVAIKVHKSSTEVCQDSEVIITATNSGTPVLPDSPALLKGKTFIAIGSYKPDMREYPDSFFSLIDKIYIDTEDGINESGDLIGPLTDRLISREQILPASYLLDNKATGETHLFKSTGMALFDLVAAILIYESYR